MLNFSRFDELAADAAHDDARPGRYSALDPITRDLRAGVVMLAIALLPVHVAAKEKAVRMSIPSEAASVQASRPARSLKETPSELIGSHHRADFGATHTSRDARQIADWIVDSADNLGLPFMIVDKIAARVFVFDSGGRIQGTAPALLGMARGDHSVPGIGDREYSDMPPETRTTPAGRFVAAMGMNARGEDVLWVDYEAAVSLHRVITSNRKERRLERLATASAHDNRISYGCINVPVRFYEKVVSPIFSGTEGIVYVLPETRPAREVFGSYDVEERARHRSAAQWTLSPKTAIESTTAD